MATRKTHVSNQEGNRGIHHILKGSESPARDVLDAVPGLQYELQADVTEASAKGIRGSIRLKPLSGDMRQKGFLKLGVPQDGALQWFVVKNFNLPIDEIYSALQKRLSGGMAEFMVGNLALPSAPPSSEEQTVRGALATLRDAIDRSGQSNGHATRLESAYSAVEATIQGHLTSLSEATTLFAVADEENTKLKKENNRLRQEVETAKKLETARTSIQFMGSVAEVSQREALVNELRMKIGRLEIERDDALKTAGDIEVQATQVQENNNVLRNNVATLEQTLEDVKRQVTEMTAQREQIIQEASMLQQRETSLRASFNGQAATVSRLKSDISTLQSIVATQSERKPTTEQPRSVASSLKELERITQQKLETIQLEQEQLRTALTMNQQEQTRLLAERETLIEERGTVLAELQTLQTSIQECVTQQEFGVVAQLAAQAKQLQEKESTLAPRDHEIVQQLSACEDRQRDLNDEQTALALHAKRQQSFSEALAVVVHALSELEVTSDSTTVTQRTQLDSEAQQTDEDLTPLEPLQEEAVGNHTKSPEANATELWLASLQGVPIGLLYTASSRRMLGFPSQFRGQHELLQRGIDLERTMRVFVDCDTEAEAMKTLGLHKEAFELNNKTVTAIMDGFQDLRFFDKPGLAYKRSVVDRLILAHPRILANAISDAVTPKASSVPETTQLTMPANVLTESRPQVKHSPELSQAMQEWLTDQQGLPVQLLYTKKSQQGFRKSAILQERVRRNMEVPGVELGAVAKIIVRSTSLSETVYRLEKYLRKTGLGGKIAMAMVRAIEAGLEEGYIYEGSGLADRLDRLSGHIQQDQKFYALGVTWRNERRKTTQS